MYIFGWIISEMHDSGSNVQYWLTSAMLEMRNIKLPGKYITWHNYFVYTPILQILL